MMIAEILLKTALARTFNKITDVLISKGIALETKEVDMHASLSDHLTYVAKWSEEINFLDLGKKKKTRSVYVNLDLSVMPSRQKIEKYENLKKKSLKNVFNNLTNHIIILGQPGAGKTTSLKLVASKLLNEEKYAQNLQFPIVLRLRGFNSISNFDIFSELATILNIQTSSNNELNVRSENKENTKNYSTRVSVFTALEELMPLVIFDGFDELSNVKKEAFLDQFETLTKSLIKTKVVLTSRTADFPYALDKVDVLEISPLSDRQIEQFAKKWLTKNAENFLSAIKSTPFYDTAVRPLTIAHLCAIYERVGKIPDKPKTVYKKIVQLLVEEWDEQRRVSRKSKFLSFEQDRKQDFLSRLAYELAKASNTSYFDRELIINAYEEICTDFDLDISDSKVVLNEIESHNGLFLQVDSTSYEFCHKSIQEYLTADYLVKLPYIESDPHFLLTIPNELAISISISSNSSLYFCSLVDTFFEKFLKTDTPNRRVQNIRRSLQGAEKLRIQKIEFMMTFIDRLLLEKPTFNSNNDVCRAFIYLYTVYYENCVNADSYGQLSLFAIDELLYNFVKFSRVIIEKNRNPAFLNSFTIEDKLYDREVFKLQKSIVVNESDHLPNYLFVPEQIMKIAKPDLVKEYENRKNSKSLSS